MRVEIGDHEGGTTTVGEETGGTMVGAWEREKLWWDHAWGGSTKGEGGTGGSAEATGENAAHSMTKGQLFFFCKILYDFLRFEPKKSDYQSAKPKKVFPLQGWINFEREIS